MKFRYKILDARQRTRSGIIQAGSREEALQRGHRAVARRDPGAARRHDEVDVRRQEVEFCCAGHEPVLRVAAGGEGVEEFATGDPPLGIVDGHEFRVGTIPFGAGDRLLVFTDGITEAASPSGELFGRARLEAALQAARGPSTGWVPELRKVVGEFAGGQPLRDDLTMIGLTRPGGDPGRV